MKNNEKNMSCAVIEDLLPAYTESLCNDETKALVQAHLAECEACAALAKNIPVAEPKAAAVPTEKKAFKKVSRKMRFQKIVSGVLAAIIVLAVIVMGVLAAGQVSHEKWSYDGVKTAIEVKRLAKKLADGDMDEFLLSVSVKSFQALPNFGDDAEYDAFIKRTQDEFKARYQAAFGDTEVRNIRVSDVGFIMVDVQANCPSATATLYYANGTSLELFFLWQGYGQYCCIPTSWLDDWERDESDAKTAFALCCGYLYDQHTNSLAARARCFVSDKQLSKVRLHMSCQYFEMQYRNQVIGGIDGFFAHDGFAVTDAVCSELRWDKEKKQMYFELMLTAKDSAGTAILTAPVYVDYNGWIPPTAEMNTVTAGGCSDALTDALLHFFG